ncbi:MAG: V-type ATPase subunit [Gaiellaceae bacterium]
MKFLAGADFAYGNTRVRARKGGLLSPADCERLVGKNVEALLGALDGTPYAQDVEAALTRQHGLRRLHEAIRLHLGRSLEEMRSFYAGPARELVDLLLSRFDVQNVVALLRAQAGRSRSAEDALLGVVPVGWLLEPLAREILRPHELAGAVALLARWTPDAAQARALRAAFTEYERSDDLAAFERAILADHVTRLAEALERAGQDGETLLRFVRREIDEQNLLVALRLRSALERGEVTELALDGELLPGGRVSAASLEAAVRGPAAVSDLRTLGGEAWRAPLARWATTGDLVALERELEQRWVADATALFAEGDPLSIDVPLAFSVAKQTEAQNLRLLGEAAVRHSDPELVRRELLAGGLA